MVAFEQDADDYVAKAFRLIELVLLVKAILRRGNFPLTERGPIKINDLGIDVARYHAETFIKLTFTEFKLLIELSPNWLPKKLRGRFSGIGVMFNN